jgi:hypothetical protein
MFEINNDSLNMKVFVKYIILKIEIEKKKKENIKNTFLD